MNIGKLKRAYICLGSNMGDRRHMMLTAIEQLHAHPDIEVECCSSIYETAPVGLKEQPDYLNMVIAIRTTIKPLDLLRLLLETERSLGRVRMVRFGPRTIDLDLLLYDEVHLQTEVLELPHPRMMERAFVLVPLLEVLPSEDISLIMEIRRALEAAEGKDDIQLWKKTNWRSESGRFAN